MCFTLQMSPNVSENGDVDTEPTDLYEQHSAISIPQVSIIKLGFSSGLQLLTTSLLDGGCFGKIEGSHSCFTLMQPL